MEKIKAANHFATSSKASSEQVRQFLKISTKYLGLTLDGDASYQPEVQNCQQYEKRVNRTARTLFESRL